MKKRIFYIVGVLACILIAVSPVASVYFNWWLEGYPEYPGGSDPFVAAIFMTIFVTGPSGAFGVAFLIMVGFMLDFFGDKFDEPKAETTDGACKERASIEWEGYCPDCGKRTAMQTQFPGWPEPKDDQHVQQLKFCCLGCEKPIDDLIWAKTV